MTGVDLSRRPCRDREKGLRCDEMDRKRCAACGWNPSVEKLRRLMLSAGMNRRDDGLLMLRLGAGKKR